MTAFMLCVGLGFSLMTSPPGEESGETMLEEGAAADESDSTPRAVLDHEPGLRLPRAVHARLAALVEEINAPIK